MKRHRAHSNLNSSSETDEPSVATTITSSSTATSPATSSVHDQPRPVAPIIADLLLRQEQGPITINRGLVIRPWRPPIMPSHLPSSSRSPGSVAMTFANLSAPNYVRTSVITHTRALSAQIVAPSVPMSQLAGSSCSQTPRGRGLAVLPSFWQGSSRGNQPPDWHTFGTIAETPPVRVTSRVTSQQVAAQSSSLRILIAGPSEPSRQNPAQYFGQHSSPRPIPQRVATESLPNLNLARNVPIGLSGTDRVAHSLRQQSSTATSSQSTTSQQGTRQLNVGQRATNAPQSAVQRSKAERLAIVTNFEQRFWEAEARLNPNVSTSQNRAVFIESLANITRAHAHAIIGTDLIPTREEDKLPFVMNVAEQFRRYFNAKIGAKKKEIDNVSLAMYHDFYNLIYPPQRDIDQAGMRRIVERPLPDIVPLRNPNPPREEHQIVDIDDSSSSSSSESEQQEEEQLEPLDLSVRRAVPENVNVARTVAEQEDGSSSSDSESVPGGLVIDKGEPLNLDPEPDVQLDEQQDDEDTLSVSDPENYVFDDEDD